MRAQYPILPLLLALPATIAVTLEDFPPLVSNLPQACQAIYSATIAGCSASDWSTADDCSAACIAGLNGMTPKVQAACAGVEISPGQSVLNAFLHDEGVHGVCGNAPAADGASSTSSAMVESTSTSDAPMTTSTTEAPTSTTEQPTVISSTTTSSSMSQVSTTTTLVVESSTSTSYTGVSASTTMTSALSRAIPSTSSAATTSRTSSTASNTAGGLTVDTSSSPSPQSTTSSSSGSSQTNYNDHSGGGSPFDSAGNLQSSGSLLKPMASSMALLAALAMTMVWL